jgi:hypothetical protein
LNLFSDTEGKMARRLHSPFAGRVEYLPSIPSMAIMMAGSNPCVRKGTAMTYLRFALSILLTACGLAQADPVTFATPEAELHLLGTRTVIVDGLTGKCRFQMRE